MKKQKMGRKELDVKKRKRSIRFFLEGEIIDAHGGEENCKTKSKNHLTKTAPK